MAGRLTALSVKSLQPGRHLDGRGLYLVVGASGAARSWIYRYRADGRLRDYGVGSAADVSLKEARETADTLRRLRREGADPIATKRAKVARRKMQDAKLITFRQAAEEYITAHQAGWRNAKHGDQWRNTLKTYAYPTIGATAVGEVTIDDVVAILTSIWSTKNETAARIRSRIESVLDFAKVRGWFHGENPARWRGHLHHVLPARAKVGKRSHHAALPYSEMPQFMRKLAAQDGAGAQALQFTILTAARTGEVIGATWSEIDLARKIWTVSAARMKGGREHRVPLSDGTLRILEAVKPETVNPAAPVFHGSRRTLPLSNMTLSAVLKRMGATITTHGFRSSFRDWTAEQTEFSGEVAEQALSHVISNKVEAAYRRGDLFGKRIDLMADWSDYCCN